ncbi:hypothetical protein Dfri01_06750 [Dyadobacter frigoris]|uniref:hypothetical protein n=1 Tax=Dyadobacter frigoris TaxID=2576211 RepID=UPI0024A428A5|nr:hypothetical protein [Dyadobacter frigoris]GLU51214.1 hypothetical protein Dfri01_06750 [Dyadobacter frigoris]
MSNLKDKTIVITGAAMGPGLAPAYECAAKEANLALIDFNETSLEKTKNSH